LEARKFFETGAVSVAEPQQANREWWESHPMTYDWERTLDITHGSREWFDEIDRRFLSSAYYAEGSDGTPFGRFLRPEYVAGKQVLEVGCGMGTHAEMLTRAGAQLTAVDQTSLAVETTRRRLAVRGLPCNVVRQDAEHLTFDDRTFDFAWTWGVIHHSTSTERCVSEIARVVKPGGRLMMMVYYRPCLVYYLHCGLIRGVLMGQLARHTLHEIYVNSTDGFFARVFNKQELGQLIAPYFHSPKITVVGLKGELYPIPRNRFKVALERATPDAVAATILGKLGSMVVIEAVRS